MKLIVKLGTPFVGDFGDDYFETDEQWEEETESLEDAISSLEKAFRIYDIYQSSDKIVACVY